MSDKDFTKQWHETEIVTTKDGEWFRKHYEPNSYEQRNEARWLGIISLGHFAILRAPELRKVNYMSGVTDMAVVRGGQAGPQNRRDILAATHELHHYLQSPVAVVRAGRVDSEDYPHYLAHFLAPRLEQMQESKFALPKTLAQKVASNIGNISSRGFGIVHRDLRYRHVLAMPNKQLTLVDWEFTNISHPAQDLAKFTYDQAAVLFDRRVPITTLLDETIAEYCENGAHPYYDDEELRTASFNIFPLAPLDRGKSLLDRRPAGYEDELRLDIELITEWGDSVET